MSSIFSAVFPIFKGHRQQQSKSLPMIRKRKIAKDLGVQSKAERLPSFRYCGLNNRANRTYFKFPRKLTYTTDAIEGFNKYNE